RAEPARGGHAHGYPRGGAGGDDVARLEGRGGAEPFDDLVGVVRHFLGIGVLAGLVVDPGLDPDVFVAASFIGGDQPGTGREESVPALGPHDLEQDRRAEFPALPVHEVPCADVVDDHVSGNVLGGLACGNPAAGLADDDGPLGFLVEPGGFGGGGDRGGGGG